MRLSREHNEKWIEGTTKIYLGITTAHDDELNIEKAEESVLEGIKLLEDRKIKPWSSIGYYGLGMFQAGCGKMIPARINLKHAERMFKEMGMDYWLSLTRQAGALIDG